jgi:hypothetical protein
MKRTPLQRKTPLARISLKNGQKASKTLIKSHVTLKSHRPHATAAEKRHMGRVAALGCIVCSECIGIPGTPAIVHHLRTDQGRMRASHFDTMPMCPHHHQGSREGVHDMGRDEFAAHYGLTEVELLHIVQNTLKVPLWKSPYLT